MVNTTSPAGSHGWSENFPEPNSGSVRSGIMVLGPHYPRSRSCNPGTRRLLKSSLSLKLSEALESLGWNLYVCNTYSNLSQTGYDLGLSTDVDTRLAELISWTSLVMPEWHWTVPEIANLRPWICQMPQTESLLISSPACFMLLQHFGDKCSHVVRQEQLSLVV